MNHLLPVISKYSLRTLRHPRFQTPLAAFRDFDLYVGVVDTLKRIDFLLA
jgi:hypothetical protein